ncbi:hypothetical protein Patl1_26610 [Pistacia atlantica]|uniref:Uncharacterized protein n=1 Tax=Pistacia atlantica TaxID=434234 RepID=A0ACC1AZE8_9ROSI|nr:hypothetical protein Patl1_26610 [Pistacia atlantica]
MKLAKSSSKLEEVFHGRVSRLLKTDLLDTLTELQRQNELELALKKNEYLLSFSGDDGFNLHLCDFKIKDLQKNLDNAGEEELAATVRKECTQYVDYPEKFLETVAQKHDVHLICMPEIWEESLPVWLFWLGFNSNNLFFLVNIMKKELWDV